MKYPLFSIKDDLIGFGTPFAADNDAVASRFFNQAISQPNSIYQLNKSQFNLYYVGIFDSETCEITDNNFRYICSALDFDKE